MTNADGSTARAVICQSAFKRGVTNAKPRATGAGAAPAGARPAREASS